jgi:hypothetical protein
VAAFVAALANKVWRDLKDKRSDMVLQALWQITDKGKVQPAVSHRKVEVGL